LAERAFDISSETVRRWALKFGPRRLDSRAALRLTRKLLKKQGFAPKIAGHRQAALLRRGFPFGNLLETNGHGAWEPTERNTFEAFRFLLQKDSDGTAIGTDNIRLLLTLGPGHSKLTGTFESQIKNTAESVLLEVTGTFSAIRITV